jgi:predicted ATP-dependent endonuclease of OLD family
MKLSQFRITNFRNIIDTDWILVNDVTAFVGQNEAGKSNIFEALYKLNSYVETEYYPDEDWPADDWKGKRNAEGMSVAEAYFDFEEGDIEDLCEYAIADTEDDDHVEETQTNKISASCFVHAKREYGEPSSFHIVKSNGELLDLDEFGLSDTKVLTWLNKKIPRFVLVQDYEFSGTTVELDQLQSRLNSVGNDKSQLSTEDQTILIVMDLAEIDLEDLTEKAKTAEGRTLRQLDKRAASAYLTQQFQKLWKQKKVKFDIDIDGTTLNIFAEDESIGFPVRLNRRSTGFRWYVSFAWKFTHATEGEFENCILLLEEPGIHLHYSGQRDLLKVFEDLSESNSILYTTHLSSMIDQGNPERVRIIESDSKHHLKVRHGVVSSQIAPMAVIESALGLTPDLSGMLGNRKVLIVEGGTDALILNKLSTLLKKDNKTGLSDQIYLWPAQTSTKTPMYAAFAIGQKWDAGVLLDTDKAGFDAAEKIKQLDLKEYSQETGSDFKILMLGTESKVDKDNVAIEDLFPDSWYLSCVNRAFGYAIQLEELPDCGTTLISKRVEKAVQNKFGKCLVKKDVLKIMLHDFDSWKSSKDLPDGTTEAAENLFKKINSIFRSSI